MVGIFADKAMKYPNLISNYVPFVEKAIIEGKWIMQSGRLIDPLTFVNIYGRSWSLGSELILKDPDEVISDAESKVLTTKQYIRLEAFKLRLANYRAMNIDNLLLRAIKENIYLEGLDYKYGSDLPL